MSLKVKRWIRLTGRDSDYMYFATRSHSNPEVEYELRICARTGQVSCECMDAQCRKRESYLLPEYARPVYNPCKHAEDLLQACDEILIGTETA